MLFLLSAIQWINNINKKKRIVKWEYLTRERNFVNYIDTTVLCQGYVFCVCRFYSLLALNIVNTFLFIYSSERAK